MGADRRTELMENIDPTLTVMSKYFKDVSTVINTSPISVSTTSVTLLSSNANRIELILQNLDIMPALIKFGSPVSVTDYNLVLSPDLDLRHGGGGSISIRNYTGDITAICESGSTTISALELVVT